MRKMMVLAAVVAALARASQPAEARDRGFGFRHFSGHAVPKLIWDAAEAHFGLPRLDLGFWQRATRQAWVQAPTKEPWELLGDGGHRSTA